MGGRKGGEEGVGDCGDIVFVEVLCKSRNGTQTTFRYRKEA